jgi:hypothetical protein
MSVASYRQNGSVLVFLVTILLTVVGCACGCCVLQLQEERDKVLDQLNMLDMQITALKSNNNELMMAVEGGQQRCAELEALLAARDRVSWHSCHHCSSSMWCAQCVVTTCSAGSRTTCPTL